MKPNLLYLVHRIPYPPNKGDKIRSFHFLQALLADYDIFLGTFVDDPDDRQYVGALADVCKQVCCVDLDPRLAKLKSVSGLLTNEALSLPYYRNAELQAWVDQTIREHSIDRALIFSSPMAQFVRKHAALTVVADFVDVDSDKWRQYAQSKAWPARWVYRREAQKLLEFERVMAARTAATLFVSEQEARLFRSLAPEAADKITYVNNGVDIERFDPALSYQRPFSADMKSIVFTGAMDYWANVDAVKWFAEQVLPLILAKSPALRFYIVGSKPAREVLQLAENSAAVIVTGRVDDVRPYIAYADLIVAPLRIARGIQNKVLEALAMNKPVVVSSAGMEGIPITQDLQLAVADTAENYADRVLAFLENQPECGDSNRRFVQDRFGWAENGRRLRQMLAGE
ncbi:TIGR03087 family PEP-CTERM/XrtA system glycosyltransferase [Methylomonas sp. EFPC3]|uniref:TIGR03087 family PEP-CTERM/XrtA system glycosyltransferase n=1 Tax=Methylomonas sp. EFPC3 TaxID=3021710 RepID=UPI002417A189|nr:TIGR03087 family PEP-CTERM/XrtA system glycosyltransferase [Methylomonas sp. EFPC3]WFP50718.1 TIGR03087 family PEP-CTERM/XrtA system glycosyltransferase [Methylomonas sp. EFPC3]